MFLNKIAGKNYFIASLILLGITILLVAAIFTLTALIPDALGHNPYRYSINSVCEFEPWRFEIEDLVVDFPDGGIITHVNETDYQRIVILLGKGTFEYNNRQFDEQSAYGIFMVIGHGLFEEIRGDNIFVPVTDQEQLDIVAAVLNRQVGVPVLWKNKIPITFHSQNNLPYFYLIGTDGKPILPPVANFEPNSIYGSALLYVIFTIIMLLLFLLFTLDHRNSRYWDHLAETHPGYLSIILVPLLAGLVTASEVVTSINDWPVYYSFGGYAFGIIFLILLARFKKIDYLDFGLRRDRIRYGYLLALFAAALIIMATRGLPGGIATEGSETAVRFVVLFMLIALPREMIWRGYIQAFLSRLTGPNWGFLLMILLVAATRYVYILFTEPWMIQYPYTYLEIAVLAPATAAVLGYLYLRTENILSCALLHSLLIFLPGIILY